jgi:restriction system protein
VPKPSAIFRGAMIGRTDKGLFITTGRFTPDAKREATRDGAPPIDLMDGEQLCEILKTLKLGVKTELVEQLLSTQTPSRASRQPEKR